MAARAHDHAGSELDPSATVMVCVDIDAPENAGGTKDGREVQPALVERLTVPACEPTDAGFCQRFLV
jgi:hypothetical protein